MTPIAGGSVPIDAGASVVMPLDNMFWGAAYGRLKNPFGHVWSIGGPVK